MQFNRVLLKKIHRWLGLIAGVQLLLWTISGFYFSLIPIDEIHGDHLLTKQAMPTPVSEFTLVSPGVLDLNHPGLEDVAIEDIRLSVVLGRPVYIVRKHRFDAQTAKRLDAVSQGEAIAIVAARTDIEIVSATCVDIQK